MAFTKIWEAFRRDAFTLAASERLNCMSQHVIEIRVLLIRADHNLSYKCSPCYQSASQNPHSAHASSQIADRKPCRENNECIFASKSKASTQAMLKASRKALIAQQQPLQDHTILPLTRKQGCAECASMKCINTYATIHKVYKGSTLGRTEMICPSQTLSREAPWALSQSSDALGNGSKIGFAEDGFAGC